MHERWWVSCAALALAAGLELGSAHTVLSSPQTFRVPGVGWIEEGLLRMMTRDTWARWRPCIIARLCKPAGDRAGRRAS